MGYRGKLREQQRARELRAQGMTLLEIARELGVSKSSVSLWVRGVTFQPRIPRWNGNFGAQARPPNVLARRKLEQIDELRRRGREIIGELSDRDLLIAGVALYAGEGSKTDGSVRFANTNPAMVALFCRWLRSFFDIDEQRLRGRIYLHEGLDIAAATSFWSRVTRIPVEQFNRPYRAVADPSIRRVKHVHGCVYVDYGCSRTHRAIMGLIAALIPSDDLPG